MASPIYLVAPPGARRDDTASALGAGVVCIDAIDALEPLAEREPGLILIDLEPGGGGGARALELAVSAAGAGQGWSLALLHGGESREVRTLSVGPPAPLEDAATPGPGIGDATSPELADVLAQISRARHDINNPLTSAMAETQLLLFDVEDGETKESLEVIQAQLRRIRDLVAAMAHLRPPPD